MGELARRRPKAVLGVLGVDARFQRAAPHRQLRLGERQRFARGDAQLPLHQVESRDKLSDRMLHLQPGVHLHEGERPVRADDEFDRAGADIVHGSGSRHRGRAHFPPPGLGQARRGRLLQDLLVPALDGAVALEEMDAMALLVGEDLNFNVARSFEVFFDQDPPVAETRDGLALAGRESARQIAGPGNHAHALAAAAG